MAAPKPITLVNGDNPTPNVDPQPFVVVGGGAVEPQEAPAVNDSPVDAGDVAADLQSLVDALVAAGVLVEAE